MELEHGELVEIHLQHNRDVVGFSRKKMLGGKGLMPYPPSAVPADRGWWTLHRKMTWLQVFGLKTAGGHRLSPKLAFIPSNPSTGQY